MELRLDGKVAIVTGGGGAFGRAYALGLAKAGALVMVADRSADAAQAVTAAIESQGGRAFPLAVDVSRADEVERMFGQVDQRCGGLDILLNLAGDSTKYRLQDLPEAEWDRILTVNLKSVFLCCKAAIPRLIARGGGRIINMASSRGLQGQPNGAHYAASKGGIIALTKSLARELAPQRITVNALAPGATDTPMWERGRSAEAIAAARRSGELGQPDDLTPSVVLLASDAGYFLTGLIVARDIYLPR